MKSSYIKLKSYFTKNVLLMFWTGRNQVYLRLFVPSSICYHYNLALNNRTYKTCCTFSKIIFSNYFWVKVFPATTQGVFTPLNFLLLMIYYSTRNQRISLSLSLSLTKTTLSCYLGYNMLRYKFSLKMQKSLKINFHEQ